MKTRRKKVDDVFTAGELAVAQIVAENLGFSDFGKFLRFCVCLAQSLEHETERRKWLIRFAWEMRSYETAHGSILAPGEKNNAKKEK